MRWLLTRLHIFIAKRNVAIYNDMIKQELAYHADHDQRIRALYRQRGDEQAVINRLVGHCSGLDWSLAGKWNTESKVRQGN